MPNGAGVRPGLSRAAGPAARAPRARAGGLAGESVAAFGRAV